ncbi:GNAT family N-acetyltransferase [Lacticaseibacillus sp. GG6-2]
MTTIAIKETNELTPQELLTIMAARIAVFVVEQDCPYQEVDAKDQTARHVMLLQAGELVAYARIIPHDDGVHLSFGRVLVVAKARHQHLGRQLVQATLAEIQRLYPNQGVLIQAQAYLQAFYASFGFKPVSATYLEDGIPHLDMLLHGN